MAQAVQVTVDDLKNLLKLTEQLPPDLYPILDKRDGATKLAAELARRFTPESIMDGLPNQNTWTSTAAFYFNQGRYTEALLFYKALYDHMLLAEITMNRRCHKGTPLVYMSDTYARLGYSLISRRYLMLTLVEDAIRESGKISPDTPEIYFRVVWGGALSDSQLKIYAEKIYGLSQANEEGCTLSGMGFTAIRPGLDYTGTRTTGGWSLYSKSAIHSQAVVTTQ